MSRVLEHLQRYAVDSPDRVALHDGARVLTFANLWQAVSRLRRNLVSGQYMVVALAGDNSLAWIVADLALLDLPVRVVPLPPFFSAQQIHHIFQQAQVELVLATSFDMQRVPGSNPAQQYLMDAELDIVAWQLPVQSRYRGEYEKVTFTSGSTGAPKGVRLGLETLENTAAAIASALEGIGIERHLSVLPYATLLENCAGLYAPLMQGITVHMRAMAELGLESPEKFNPLLLAKALGNVQPHATILVPQLLLALVTMKQHGLLAQVPFRFIAVGGGKVSAQLLQQADALHLPVYEGYGLSECGSVVALNTPHQSKHGTAGKALSHVRIHVDNQGEIKVSDAVMKGYLGEPTLGISTIATGDVGRIDEDGFLVVSGRRKNLFITAFGRNVNPEWVEAELQCQMPIAQAAVFGEAMPFNIAVIVPRQGFDERAVREAVADCNLQLPDYARVGRVVIAREPFSIGNGMATANGRIRRDAIAHYFANQLNPEVDNGIFSATSTTH